MEEECVNDSLDDGNKHNLFEENDTKLNDEYEDYIEGNLGEEHITTYAESLTSE